MTSFIVDKDGNQIDASTVSSKPSDRHFRNAWAISGKVITEDMTKAKEIFKAIYTIKAFGKLLKGY